MAEQPEDLNLPASVVNKIIKESLPDGVIVSKDAKIAVGRAASVFVLYAATSANQVVTSQKRKTMTGQDVLKAMDTMGFPEFINPLKEYFEVFKKGKERKKEDAARKKRAKELEKESQETEERAFSPPLEASPKSSPKKSSPIKKSPRKSVQNSPKKRSPSKSPSKASATASAMETD
ncbi:unnamed protein product [Darwinula stevensoni]|uniref:DNA polymerase epsilon subunit 3 n=1 Tax=Darwinula stevensoni TaxID=69355 RepID=A0A7R9AD02_9CRUS|nr:unnamed protein product [Darwinula stevensoni]CAG0900852.1 unnamed protein product [Darwinula stevensoni]